MSAAADLLAACDDQLRGEAETTGASGRSAVRRGTRDLGSGSTEDARPILERRGFANGVDQDPCEWCR